MTPPPFHWWRTVFFLIPVLTISTVAFGTLSLVSTLFDPRGFFAHRCAQWWASSILRTTGVRLAVHGRLPDEVSCIVVANHSSFYDIPVLFVGVPRQLRLMAKASLARVPFIGWHLVRSGHLLVNRSNPGASIFKRMKRMAGAGTSLLVFPEAGRLMDGRLLPFKPGIFLLAIESGLPLVPVSLSGTRAVMPRGRLAAHPARVDVTIHEPIATSGLRRDDARALAERVRAIVASAVPEAQQ